MSQNVTNIKEYLQNKTMDLLKKLFYSAAKNSNDIFLEVDVHCDVLRKCEMGEQETKCLRQVQSWSRQAQAENYLEVQKNLQVTTTKISVQAKCLREVQSWSCRAQTGNHLEVQKINKSPKAKINNVSSSDIFLEVDVHCDIVRRLEMGEKEIKH